MKKVLTSKKYLNIGLSFVSEKSVLWKFTLCDCRFYRQFIVWRHGIYFRAGGQIWEV